VGRLGREIGDVVAASPAPMCILRRPRRPGLRHMAQVRGLASSLVETPGRCRRGRRCASRKRVENRRTSPTQASPWCSYKGMNRRHRAPSGCLRPVRPPPSSSAGRVKRSARNVGQETGRARAPGWAAWPGFSIDLDHIIVCRTICGGVQPPGPRSPESAPAACSGLSLSWRGRA